MVPSAIAPDRTTPAADLEADTGLLDAELPDPRFVDTAYLSWLYDQNPHGPAISRRVDADGRRVAHYALIPQRYIGPNGPIPAAFSLNAVVRDGHQRAGHFRTMGLEIYEEAAVAGWRFVVGVSNDKSTPAVVKHMGWRLIGPMPVRLLHPFRRTEHSVDHHAVTPSFLASASLENIAAGLAEPRPTGFTNLYSTDQLRWRLACPHVSYHVHIGRELVAISTVSEWHGVRAAVILKLLPRANATGPVASSPLIGAILRYHRAVFGVYAGFNREVPLRGVRPPRRLQPSPLNLIVRHLSPDFDQDALVLDTFEFLDADAY